MKVLTVPKSIKVFMADVDIDLLVGDLAPRCDPMEQVFEDTSFSLMIRTLSPIKQKLAQGLADGFNVNEMGRRLGLKTSAVFRLKREMQKDLRGLQAQHKWYPEDEMPEKVVLDAIRKEAEEMPLSRFIKIFIADYYEGEFVFPEKLADRLEKGGQIYFTDPEAKKITVICYLIRQIFLRKSRVVIDYYHQDRGFLVDMIRRFKRLIRTSPVLNDCLEPITYDDDFGVRFRDGSLIRTYYEKRKAVNRGNILILDDGSDELFTDFDQLTEPGRSLSERVVVLTGGGVAETPKTRVLSAV